MKVNFNFTMISSSLKETEIKTWSCLKCFLETGWSHFRQKEILLTWFIEFLGSPFEELKRPTFLSETFLFNFPVAEEDEKMVKHLVKVVLIQVNLMTVWDFVHLCLWICCLLWMCCCCYGSPKNLKIDNKYTWAKK